MTTPDQHKDNGNKLFANHKYDEAIAEYTSAIEKAGNKPSCVFFANRANVYLS